MALKYSPELTLREARERYFEINNFPGGGYDERWVKMKAGPLPIWFPNIPARHLAVRFHDLHHVLTEYETTWRGETEIGAWEVATGCAHFWVGWLLDLLAFAVGLALCPRRVFRAFVRGRRSSNLYRGTFDDALLAQQVGAMRRQLRLDDDRAGARATANAREVFAFAAWSLVSVGTYAAAGVALFAPPVAGLVLLLWLTGNLGWLRF
jgi:hypothetical protein